VKLANNDADFLKRLTPAGLTYQDPALAVAAGKYCPKYLTGEGQQPKPPGAKGN
jgi:hypothetical protein